jgi:hypothetical protein
MQAKYVSNDKFSAFKNNTPETIYEVFDSKSDSACYEVYLFGEHLGGWHKSRFKIISEPTLEQQLQTAKNKVAEIEAKIEAAKPKVGQKYRHRNGSIWMIVQVNGCFVLICIEDNRAIDTGKAYGGIHSNIDYVFDGFDHNFTLIP